MPIAPNEYKSEMPLGSRLTEPLSVMPFIPRGVALLGVDSVMAPFALREKAWSRLATELELSHTALAVIPHGIALGDAIANARELIDGKVRGRIVVLAS